jgi:hypothetical protein
MTRLQEEGFTHKELRAWLASEGIKCSQSTLERRLRSWGLRGKAATEITDELAERVNDLFHHSLLTDTQIATMGFTRQLIKFKRFDCYLAGLVGITSPRTKSPNNPPLNSTFIRYFTQGQVARTAADGR